jgi:hypothetical protein
LTRFAIRVSWKLLEGNHVHKEKIVFAAGVAVVILLRNMLARTLNPFLSAVKITWPV